MKVGYSIEVSWNAGIVEKYIQEPPKCIQGGLVSFLPRTRSVNLVYFLVRVKCLSSHFLPPNLTVEYWFSANEFALQMYLWN